MLVIRMQRTGRKGHAMFRVVVQDSRLTPTSGKVVAAVGSYDPHSKTVKIDKDKAAFYLEHGAQPSDRVARLLKSEGVKLPDWVSLAADKERIVRNADKRRSTRPEAPAEEASQEPEASAPEPTTEDTTAATDTPAEAPASDSAEEATDEPAEDSTEPEAPAAEVPATEPDSEASDDSKSA